MTHHRIVFGDSRQLNLVEDQSVQLIVTSPPYWQLKDYGNENQIGFHDDYETYINNLNLVWKECYRVLSDGCRMCINIGDQFARAIHYGRYKVIPIRTEIIRFCETLGFDYMGAVIWQKTTTMNTSGGGAVMGSFPYPRNGILKIDYEFILIFKKLGNAPKPSVRQKEASALTKEEWNEYFSSHWNFTGVRQTNHIAMFPEELPRRLIKMFSFEGETVFDPFLGSGTTSSVARELNRNSIGYEINEQFKPIIEEKIGLHKLNLDNATIVFSKDAITDDLSFNILPYYFNDPHKINKKIDVKKLSFGSRFDDSPAVRQTFYTVKRILSPDIVELSNNVKLRLIGIKSKTTHYSKAVSFLNDKCANRRVYIRYDSNKYDANDTLMGYLYLDNRTFINNHLIRTGFVDVDTTFQYAQQEKFLATAKSAKLEN